MGLPTSQHDYARYRDGPSCGNDRRKASPRLRAIRRCAGCGLTTLLVFVVWTGFGWGKDLRIATLHAELTRKGPGLLLRDLEAGKDKQIAALAQLIGAIDPDVLLLTKVDVDAGGVTLAALQEWLGYPYGHTEMPNSAFFASNVRMAWGPFAGAGGMVLLSKRPLEIGRTTSYNSVLWRDLKGAVMPVNEAGENYFPPDVSSSLRLVTHGLWTVQIDGISLVTFQNTTPVFDGIEDRNGRRSRDQLRLIEQVLDNIKSPFVALGNTNLDPNAGSGDRDAMRSFLQRSDLKDPTPVSEVGGLNTAIWEKPGPMRVSYVLPSRDFIIKDSGIVWPRKGLLREWSEQASRHRLVWLDITR